MPYSTANGIKIYYEVSGEGLPFVMVHANPFDHNLWMYQIAHFSTYFKVIGIDIRGYGRSDKPETPFSLKDMADDVLGVCRDLGMKEAILGGVSVGSGMAILLGPRSSGDVQSDHSRRRQQRRPGGPSTIASTATPKIGIEKYHIQHLRELVAPDFPETKLGKYLLNTFVERDPWLSGESIAQIFRARGGTRHDAAARIDESADIGDQRRIRQLACRRQENRVVDPRRRAQDSAQDRTRLQHRRSRRLR